VVPVSAIGQLLAEHVAAQVTAVHASPIGAPMAGRIGRPAGECAVGATAARHADVSGTSERASGPSTVADLGGR